MQSFALASVYAQALVWMVVGLSLLSMHTGNSEERGWFRYLLFGFGTLAIGNASNWLADPAFIHRMDADNIQRWTGLRVLTIFMGLCSLAWTQKYRQPDPDPVTSPASPTEDETMQTIRAMLDGDDDDMPTGPNTPPPSPPPPTPPMPG